MGTDVCCQIVMSFWSIVCSGMVSKPAMSSAAIASASAVLKMISSTIRRWQDKETLIANTGLPCLKQPIREQLAELEQRLEDRLVEVNQRIASGRQ